MRRLLTMIPLFVFAFAVVLPPAAEPQTSASRTLTITAQANHFVVLDITPDTQTCIFDASNIGQTVTCGTSTVSWQTRCGAGATISSTMGPPTPAQFACSGQPNQNIQPGYRTGSASVTCTAVHDPALAAGTYVTSLTVNLACN